MDVDCFNELLKSEVAFVVMLNYYDFNNIILTFKYCMSGVILNMDCNLQSVPHVLPYDSWKKIPQPQIPMKSLRK